MMYSVKQVVVGHKVTVSNLNKEIIVHGVNGYSVYAEVKRQQCIYNDYRTYVVEQTIAWVGVVCTGIACIALKVCGL
ncbi:MAG: hypothetical protein GY787_21425 [Alteromonadales bacterium]|nr:hypothetical protein [Alteromonadales bacterium]